MSKKCKAYSESKIGMEQADNRKAFYAGWDAAMLERQPEHNLQCWDYNNPEHGALDADMLAEYFADSMRDDEEESFRVMVSVPQPDRIMIVRLSGGDERTMTWRWW